MCLCVDAIMVIHYSREAKEHWKMMMIILTRKKRCVLCSVCVCVCVCNGQCVVCSVVPGYVTIVASSRYKLRKQPAQL